MASSSHSAQHFRISVLLALALTATAQGSWCARLPSLMSGAAETPSFESQPANSRLGQYLWRNGRITANFVSGGVVTLGGIGNTPIVLRFPGANLNAVPRGEAALERKTLYYLGPREDWHENAHFARVRYREVYPGIDLVFITTAGALEYNFEVRPRADTGSIRIRFEGARLSVGRSGNLDIRTDTGSITQRQPRVTQGNSTNREINCRYVPLGAQQVRLHLEGYDRNAALVIDPTLSFSTYIGGSGFDAIYATTVDSSGNVYIAGETSSGSLWNNSLLPRSSRDAFVAKLNSSATQVLFTVYLGGSGNDSAKGIAVDASGNVYITGITSSANFPVTAGALSTTAPGPQSAFVAKLNTFGGLQYSTYLGGATADFGYAIAVDSTGAVYVAGETESVGFPVTTGAFQTTFQGGTSDCFVSKLNPAASALVYSTFLGGSGQDLCSGIAIDPAGNSYVAGISYSTNFPVLNPLQSLGGTASAFVTKINAAGSALVYSTLLGGTNIDLGNAIAVDGSGSAYVAGATASIDFPVTGGVLQSTQKGIYNAFVSKLSPAGSSLVYSTLLGGANSDTATSIAVDAMGRAFVGGYTSSTNFPTAAPVQPAFGGAFDAFASVLDPAAATLIFSSYFGGAGDDKAYAIAIVPGGNIYLGGATASGNFPTVAAVQPGLNVAYDSFLLEVGALGLPTPPSLSISALDSGNFLQGQQGATYMLTVSNAANATATSGAVTVTESMPAGLTLVSMTGGGWSCGGNVCSRSDPLAAGLSYPAITAMVSVLSTATSPQVNFVSVSGGGSLSGSTTNSTTVGANSGSGVLTDLALYQTATQSSTYAPGFSNASDAVDGNIDGAYADGSVSSTNDDTNAWWQMDLGAPANISSIVVWNRTDGAGGRLSDYWVFVSNTPFLATDTPATLQSRAGTFNSHQTVMPSPSGTVTIPGAQGRYVRVQLTGTNWLGLAEVQVFGTAIPLDLALNQPASQSSTFAPGFSNASNAVDANTDGAYADGSVSSTNNDANAWWEVDLGTTATVSSIVVWNRTDGAGGRLSDYWVFISNTPFLATDTPTTLQSRAGTFNNHQTIAPSPSSTIMIAGAQGRYVRVQLTATNYLGLAEVQVFGTLASQDLALGRTAAQSSTYAPGFSTAADAVDGSTDGAYADGSVSSTNDDTNAWWGVDLGASANITSVVIWNRTDGSGGRLSNYWVFVSNTPFLSTDTPATLQSRPGTWSSFQAASPSPSATVTIPGAQGRYVRVQLSDANWLALAEVQVFGPVVIQDLALNHAATQSSTYAPGFSTAAKALDGDTDGAYADGSVSCTNNDVNAWWEADLGASANIGSIVIWNRTDGAGGRLSDFWVFVSNTPFLATDTPTTLQSRAGTFSNHQTAIPNPSVSIGIPGAQGRYVRVQLTGTNYLALSEVQIFGVY